MRILLIEDDDQLASYLKKALVEVGMVVDRVADGRDGLFLAAGEHYDVMIIDRMLPSLDGLSIVRTLRTSGKQTPVLILSALGEVDDRVQGLRAGGDDYLIKPFSFAELHARLGALLRRGSTDTPQTELELCDLKIDLLSRQVTRTGKTIELQPLEYRLLEYLMQHAGQVVTRTMLLENVWDYHFDPQTNVIDVHISRLRGKIDRDFNPALLHTVRGAGYILRDPV
ncbi:MAG: winged helix-turn-helix domain-containing protein [Gammaproteobacteria bacterium]